MFKAISFVIIFYEIQQTTCPRLDEKKHHMEIEHFASMHFRPDRPVDKRFLIWTMKLLSVIFVVVLLVRSTFVPDDQYINFNGIRCWWIVLDHLEQMIPFVLFTLVKISIDNDLLKISAQASRILLNFFIKSITYWKLSTIFKINHLKKTREIELCWSFVDLIQFSMNWKPSFRKYSENRNEIRFDCKLFNQQAEKEADEMFFSLWNAVGFWGSIQKKRSLTSNRHVFHL